MAGGGLPQRGPQLLQLLDATDERPPLLHRRGGDPAPACLTAGISRVGHRGPVSGLTPGLSRALNRSPGPEFPSTGANQPEPPPKD
jgi:hypothetical protein